MRPSQQTPSSPLLSDEELDALIQAFNRRDSTPPSWTRGGLWLAGLVLIVIGASGWWWS